MFKDLIEEHDYERNMCGEGGGGQTIVWKANLKGLQETIKEF
mgnify:CR=1 FL=1